MSEAPRPGARLRDRLPPIVLAVAGAALVVITLQAWDRVTAAGETAGAPLSVVAGAQAALGLFVTVRPRPLLSRRLLAAVGLLWLLILTGVALTLLRRGELAQETAVLLGGLGFIQGAALLGLAATTPEVADGRLPGLVGRVGVVIALAAAIVVSAVVVVGLVALIGAVFEVIGGSGNAGQVEWLAVTGIVVLPVVPFVAASVGSRRAAAGTFDQQASGNRRNSLLLLVALVGVVAATGEILTVALTLSPAPALWAAGIAGGIGLLAALGAERLGSGVILRAAGARPADRPGDEVLRHVVAELSLAAGIPAPAAYVIESPSLNAFSTGRDPQHGAIAVTSGLLARMDREELQGVVSHELAHIRNLDSRYALYVAILVGLVATVTDGFLRLVGEGWKQGVFFWSSDDEKGIVTVAAGIAFGVFLTLVALLLRLVAPFFSLLVQAAVSREREFLADATAVEITRNPRGLERALAAVAQDHADLAVANRGTQHLWFRNPIRAGSDRRPGLLATHPSIGARIERLRALQGLAAGSVGEGSVGERPPGHPLPDEASFDPGGLDRET